MEYVLSIGYTNNPELLQITIERSGETIDWLIDVLGVAFKDEVIVNPTYGWLQMCHNMVGMGAGLYPNFVKALEDRGIPCQTETRAYKLIHDEKNGVVGVIARAADGTDTYIKADAVVLATGGYGSNIQMASALDTFVRGSLSITPAWATGDGVVMATEVGGYVANANLSHAVLGDYDAMVNHGATGFDPWIFNTLMKDGGTIFVDQSGSRYTNEPKGGAFQNDTYSAMHKYNMPHTWAIFNQNTVDLTPPRALGLPYDLKADTLAELGTLLGIDEEALTATVTEWNAICENGVDVQFGRTTLLEKIETGPYYALAIVPAICQTNGGIARNVRSEVIRVDGSPIKGLYVSGEAAEAATENGFTMSHAATWGRLAGLYASEYCLDKPAYEAKYMTETEAMDDMLPIEEQKTDYSFNAGTYTGVGAGINGSIIVEVVFTQDAIESVTVKEHSETQGISDPAFARLPGEIVAAQSVDVDTIAGATRSSVGIIEAVTDAMQQAEK
jgi:fumarate reductase flavoprotein subunit